MHRHHSHTSYPESTIFLDEFQSVSTASQVQLLDLLSAVSDVIHIARTGEDHKRHRFNVKVILAINEDIDTLLHNGRLRKDVYFQVRTVEKFLSLKERLDRDLEHRSLPARPTSELPVEKSAYHSAIKLP